MAVGYKGNNTAFTAAGLVRVFDWNGNAWVQYGDTLLGDGINVYSGHSVALSDDGTILAIGAIQGTGPVNQFTNKEGQVRIYRGGCSVSTTAVTQNGNSLMALANGTYQWLDCNNGNQPIANATGQTFVAQNAGSYSVQITENGCTQTSNCITVLPTSASEPIPFQIQVYPNPTSDWLFVNSARTIEKIQVMDITGKSVMTSGKGNAVDFSGLSKGLYQLRLQFENDQVEYQKVLKQ
jgi:hypothetical protein